MKDQDVAGEVLKISGKKASVAFGHIKTYVSLDTLKKVSEESVRQRNQAQYRKPELGDWNIGKRKLKFTPDIDVRGKRAEEALQLITEFIDEAIMVQASELRILHGKGNGILRELIRQQLSVIDVVERYADEHVERGGSGVTLVKIGG